MAVGGGQWATDSRPGIGRLLVVVTGSSKLQVYRDGKVGFPLPFISKIFEIYIWGRPQQRRSYIHSLSRKKNCMRSDRLQLLFFVSSLLSFCLSMPKLYFRYGAVASAKTLNLLAVAHTYRLQGKNVMVMKPSIDTRFGVDKVVSRAGLERTADVLIHDDTNLLDITPDVSNLHCVLVDEVQFLAPEHIDQLRSITLKWNVPVVLSSVP
jgi:hypothetical protein